MPRKTWIWGGNDRKAREASMRPRPDATENDGLVWSGPSATFFQLQ